MISRVGFDMTRGAGRFVRQGIRAKIVGDSEFRAPDSTAATYVID